MGEMFPFVSIVIPTFNRGNYLSITLDSFLSQDYPKDSFEIIIANNNSTDNTASIIEKYCANYSNIKMLFESRQGVHYARNSAAKIAKGDILYYTDDDMIADRNLLSEIIKAFLMDDKVATATGRVLPKWEVQPPQWISDYCYNGLLSLNDPREDFIISPYDCGVFSCHQAIRRDILFAAGGFNPENTAGEWIGDGETGLNIKIRDLGYKFAYIGDAVTYHMIPKERMTQRYLNRRLANQGNCDSYTEYKKNIYSKWMLYKKILSHTKNLMKNLIYALIRIVLFKNKWRINWARVYYYINRIKYDFRLIKDEHWRRLVLKYDWLNELNE